MRAAVLVEVGMMFMVAMFPAVPVLAPEAVAEQCLVGMAVAALLRPAEKAASLVFIQHGKHVLPGEENVRHAGNGMGIHDRGRYVLVGSDRYED